MDAGEGTRPRKTSESALDYYPYAVLPQDLNPLGTIHGRRVLALLDDIAALVAQRHSKSICVTLGVDRVRFLAPARQGETLVFRAAVNRVWNTSMEIGIKLFAENYITGENRHILSAYLTFVALNKSGERIPITPVQPETEDEKRRYHEAEERRKYRLEVDTIWRSRQETKKAPS